MTPADWSPNDTIEALREAERATLIERRALEHRRHVPGWMTSLGFMSDWRLENHWRRIETSEQ